MAKIERAPRAIPARATAEDLSHTRNREDLPVLRALFREVNLRGGEKQNVSADYEVATSDGTIFVDSSSGEVTVTLPKLVDDEGDALPGLDEKQIRVHRSGFSAVTVKDADGSTIGNVSNGLALLFMANNGAWYRMTF